MQERKAEDSELESQPAQQIENRLVFCRFDLLLDHYVDCDNQLFQEEEKATWKSALSLAGNFEPQREDVQRIIDTSVLCRFDVLLDRYLDCGDCDKRDCPIPSDPQLLMELWAQKTRRERENSP